MTDHNKIIFLGDSLTAFHDWSAFGSHHNAGIAGDTTDGLLHRLHYTLDKHPDIVILMIGINDLLQGQYIETMQNNYLKIFEALKSIKTVYLLSILPVEAIEQTIQVNENVILLNHLIKSECPKRGFVYVDLYNLMVDNNLGIQKELTSDGVHLTTQAYTLWESALKARLTTF